MAHSSPMVSKKQGNNKHASFTLSTNSKDLQEELKLKRQQSRLEVILKEQQEEKLLLKNLSERKSAYQTLNYDFNDQVSKIGRIKQKIKDRCAETLAHRSVKDRIPFNVDHAVNVGELCRQSADIDGYLSDDLSYFSNASSIRVRETLMERNNEILKRFGTDKISDADVFVSTSQKYALFPVADKEIFPLSRRKGAKGWQIGLRDEDFGLTGKSKARGDQTPPKIDPHVSEEESATVEALNSANAKLRGKHSKIRTPKGATTGSRIFFGGAGAGGNRSRSLSRSGSGNPGLFPSTIQRPSTTDGVSPSHRLSVRSSMGIGAGRGGGGESDRRHTARPGSAISGSSIYIAGLPQSPDSTPNSSRPGSSRSRLNSTLFSMPDLPPIEGDQEEKYFGERAKFQFFDTYTQLKRRGNVLVGGYNELENILFQNDSENPMSQSLSELQASGLLSPKFVLSEDPVSPSSRGATSGRGRKSSVGRDEEEEEKEDINRSFSLASGGGGKNMESLVEDDERSGSVTSLHAAGPNSVDGALCIDGKVLDPSLSISERGGRGVDIEATQVFGANGLALNELVEGSFATDASIGITTAATTAASGNVFGDGAIDKGGKGKKNSSGQDRDRDRERGHSTMHNKRSPSGKERKDASGAKRGSARGQGGLQQGNGELMLGGKDGSKVFGEDSSELRLKLPKLPLSDVVRNKNNNCNNSSSRTSSRIYRGNIRTGKLFDTNFVSTSSSRDEEEEGGGGEGLGGRRGGSRGIAEAKAAELAVQDELLDIDGSKNKYGPSSPRAIFLNGCLKRGIPPLSVSLIRKRISSEIDLSHMGIGNEVAIVLSTCLSSVPHLQSLDLSDNNLEDDGLCALINSIAAHPTIEKLDISQNVIDHNASDALANFIGNSECMLKSLHMSDANIDDSECARFVEVLMHNRHLLELDLSKNLLGKDENLNVVNPDFVTGGESLAELISSNRCPLQKLNLHWNMIRLEGAEVLCDSLSLNNTLIELDISYNALGRTGAQVFGRAIMENATLKKVNLANNNIDAIGCFTILVGIRENQSLEFINLDGNPVGEQGGRMLMKLAESDGHRLAISAVRCDFTIRSNEVKLKVNDPCGEYELDLSSPYDRAIALELMDIAAQDPGIDIATCLYNEFPSIGRPVSAKLPAPTDARPGSGRPASGKPAAEKPRFRWAAGGGFEELKIDRYETPSLVQTKKETRELSEQEELINVLQWSEKHISQVLKKYDLYGTDTISSRSLNDVLVELKVHCTHDQLEEIRIAADPTSSRHIEIPRLMEFIISRAEIARDRVHDLTHSVFCAVTPLSFLAAAQGAAAAGTPLHAYSPNSGISQRATRKSGAASANSSVLIHPDNAFGIKRYVPPPRGVLRLRVIEGFLMVGEISCRPISKVRTKQIVAAAEKTSNPLILLLYAIENQRLYLEESKLLYSSILSKTEDSVLVIASLMLRMYLSNDAMMLVRSMVGHDALRLRRLKQRLGHAYRPLLGLYSGYYCLDLAVSEDRICMSKLIEQNIRNEHERRVSNKWDTSQNGNWSCFRNEYHITHPERSISPKYFVPIPHHGKLEFDFVNICRPNPRINKPLADDRVIDILLVSRLLREEKVDLAYRRLKDLSIAGRKTFLSNGNPYWHPDLGRALSVGDALYNMYTNLPNRRKSLQKAGKREAMKVNPATVPTPRIGSGRRTIVVIADKAKPTTASPAGKGRTSMFKQATGGKTAKPKLLSVVQSVAQTEKAAEFLIKFRSLVNKELNTHSMGGWRKRMYEVMFESNGTEENKSVALLEFFEAEISSTWFYCKQLALITDLFRIGSVQKSSFGSYRVEFIILVFDKIIDLHNFEIVMMMLNAEEQASIYARIGYLNVFNPCKPEGGWQLDLQRWEERQLAKMLIHLSVVEPGENWLNKGFIFDHGHLPMPGWDLNVGWFQEDGLPKKGIVSFEMFAGDGLNLLGCSVNRQLRNILTSLVLVEQRELDYEIEDGTLLRDERNMVLSADGHHHGHGHGHGHAHHHNTGQLGHRPSSGGHAAATNTPDGQTPHGHYSHGRASHARGHHSQARRSMDEPPPSTITTAHVAAAVGVAAVNGAGSSIAGNAVEDRPSADSANATPRHPTGGSSLLTPQHSKHPNKPAPHAHVGQRHHRVPGHFIHHLPDGGTAASMSLDPNSPDFISGDPAVVGAEEGAAALVAAEAMEMTLSLAVATDIVDVEGVSTVKADEKNDAERKSVDEITCERVAPNEPSAFVPLSSTASNPPDLSINTAASHSNRASFSANTSDTSSSAPNSTTNNNTGNDNSKKNRLRTLAQGMIGRSASTVLAQSMIGRFIGEVHEVRPELALARLRSQIEMFRLPSSSLRTYSSSSGSRPASAKNAAMVAHNNRKKSIAAGGGSRPGSFIATGGDRKTSNIGAFFGSSGGFDGKHKRGMPVPHFSYEDANSHLEDNTEITWNYTTAYSAGPGSKLDNSTWLPSFY